MSAPDYNDNDWGRFVSLIRRGTEQRPTKALVYVCRDGIIYATTPRGYRMPVVPSASRRHPVVGQRQGVFSHSNLADAAVTATVGDE